MKQAGKTRDHLIDTALATVRTHGIGGLTLDAVAKEAGVSKGGLLHHFRSKNMLVETMLRRLLAQFEARVQTYAEQEVPAPGRWLRAYVRATFDDEPPPLELVAVLLSGMLENNALLTLVRDDWQHWHDRLINDGVPAARAQVIRQAADAYWSERLMDVAPTDSAARSELMAELLRLVEV
jgi:AcrR family transcriptional regulator